MDKHVVVHVYNGIVISYKREQIWVISSELDEARTEEPGGQQSMGLLRVGHDWATSLSLFTYMHCRRKWQPTPCSCLENSRDGGAWWAAIYGVAESRTRLMWLSSSRASYTAWNKSEREKQISYINTYMWNLEKRHWWTYFQGKIRVSVMDKRIMDTAGKERMDWIERVALKYTDYHV